jgi:hypothetical protein
MKVKQIKTLSGLCCFAGSSNIFWPTAVDMHHHNLCLQVAYTFYPHNSFKELAGPALKSSQLKKYIWYANNHVTIEQHTKMLGKWINNQGFKSNIVPVTGAQMKKAKFHHANFFAATSFNLPNLSLLENCNCVMQTFNLHIVMAISVATVAKNAGHPC